MSTDDSQPTGAPVATQEVPGDPGAPYFGGAAGPAEEPEPGWFDRNATLVIRREPRDGVELVEQQAPAVRRRAAVAGPRLRVLTTTLVALGVSAYAGN